MLSPLIGLADEATPASHVIRLLQPGHRCGRSPDSVEPGGEIGEFRAHDGREKANIGHLALDQDITPPYPKALLRRDLQECDQVVEPRQDRRAEPVGQSGPSGVRRRGLVRDHDVAVGERRAQGVDVVDVVHAPDV